MAGSYFQSRHTIEKNNITVFSSNYPLYGDLSWRVMETLRSFSPQVEVYSVDEAFIDLDGIEENQLFEYASQIRNVVEQWTGISVSVGVAPTKTLAKIANHVAKKNKQATGCVKVLTDPEKIRSALQRVRVNEIWGVGGAYANKLINWGIISAWDLCNMPEEWENKHLGGLTIVRIIKELKGDQA
jgi:DNA polymerase V